MTGQTEPDPSSPSDYAYWAFISYSQRDVKWAQWLQTVLETYRIPRGLAGPVGARALPAKLFPVFRDRDELPSAADLGGKIREALRRSRTLIVVCSPRSARSPWVNEEVKAFKALGRADRVFPIIIDGEPYASDKPESGLEECFPLAVRFAVASDGTITTERAEPIAADARPGKDGPRHAALKLIAGILDVGFDALRNREARRRRRSRLIQSAGAAGAIALAALGYVALADADLSVPGGTEIRRRLDRNGLSVIRSIPADSTIAGNRNAARRIIRTRLIGDVDAWKLDNTAWGLGQVLSALYLDPDVSAADLRKLPPIVAGMFREGFLVTKDGVPREWNDGYSHARAEAPIWTMMALAAALGRTEALTEAERAQYLGYLDLAQQIAQQFVVGDDGGWNVVAEEPASEHYIYSTALALHALLDLRRAELGWRGDRERLDDMIRRTSAWLASDECFNQHPKISGWKRMVRDDKPPDPELSLLVFSALGRANLETDFPIPAKIEQAAFGQLAELRKRAYDPANHDILHQVKYTDEHGVRHDYSIPSRVMWYPWSVVALDGWIEYARRHGRPLEDYEALRRSRSHLLTTVVKDMEGEMQSAMIFVVAENGYGFNVRPGKRDR